MVMKRLKTHNSLINFNTNLNIEQKVMFKKIISAGFVTVDKAMPLIVKSFQPHSNYIKQVSLLFARPAKMT
jgi:hypothetical protein